MLQLSSARAGEVDSALLAVADGAQLRQPAASLQLQVRLLHAARPGDFPAFRAFRRWQAATCACLSAILVWSAGLFRLEQVRCMQLFFFFTKSTPHAGCSHGNAHCDVLQ